MIDAPCTVHKDAEGGRGSKSCLSSADLNDEAD